MELCNLPVEVSGHEPLAKEFDAVHLCLCAASTVIPGQLSLQRPTKIFVGTYGFSIFTRRDDCGGTPSGDHVVASARVISPVSRDRGNLLVGRDLFLADGAYDGEPTSDVLAFRFASMIEVTIPPPKNAVLSPNAALHPTVCDRHIAEIAARGRIAWQKASGYNQRSRGETLMGCWKTVIGPKLKARNFGNQKTEAKIGVRVLNRMTGLGRPHFERTA